MEDPGRGHAFRYGITFFWLSGEVQMRTELTDHVSRKQGRGWFRRVRLPPPAAGLGPFPSASIFLFPCPFRVRPWWARCVGVGVSLGSSSIFLFSPSCVPVT